MGYNYIRHIVSQLLKEDYLIKTIDENGEQIVIVNDDATIITNNSWKSDYIKYLENTIIEYGLKDNDGEFITKTVLNGWKDNIMKSSTNEVQTVIDRILSKFK